MIDRQKILQLKMAIEAISNMFWASDDPEKLERVKEMYPTVYGLTWHEIETTLMEFADHIEELTDERDRFRAFVKNIALRAKSAEHAADEKCLIGFDNISFERDCDITHARAALAQIDVEPAEPRQPTVKEAAKVLLGGFESPLLAALDPLNNSVDVAEDVLAALRALAEGDNQ